MGRWAKNHDQRKGQWLYNKVRLNPDFDCVDPCDVRREVADAIWDMTNEEFDKIME